MTGEQRADLDEAIRGAIREARAHAGATSEDVLYLLTRMLPEVEPSRPRAMGHLLAAYDLADGRPRAPAPCCAAAAAGPEGWHCAEHGWTAYGGRRAG